MKRRLLLLVVVGIVAIACIIAGKRFPIRASHENLKIGFVISLTGSDGKEGSPIANVIEILKDEYPDVSFYVEDSKSQPATGVNAARKVIDVDHVDLVYCDLSNITAAIQPITEAKSMLFMATVLKDDFIESGKYTIRNFVTMEDQSRALLSSLTDLQGDVDVAILVSNDEVGHSSVKGFIAAAQNSRFHVQSIDEWDENNIRNTAIKVASKNTPVIFVSSFSAALGTVIKELRTAGYTGRILTQTAFTFPYIREMAGEAGKGVIHAEFPKTGQYDKLVSLYHDRYHSIPPLTAFLCYDGISMFITAWRASDSKRPESILEELEKVHHEGAYGELTVVNREIKYPLTWAVSE